MSGSSIDLGAMSRRNADSTAKGKVMTDKPSAQRQRLWIVEMSVEKGWTGRFQWEPTVGCGLSRADGREELKQWQEKNSGDFRLVKYVPARKP